MANERIPGQNVLSQVVACLISTGYQVNQYIMDTWSYGSSQHRSRLFMTVAAPGLDPIAQPWHTHSRSHEQILGKSFGRLPNGQRFGEREYYPTPFPQLTAAALTSDVPDIGDGNVLTCIPFPDHCTVCPPGRSDRAILQCIPSGSSYKGAFDLELIPSSLHKLGRENTKGYTRIKSSGLIPCITTGQSLQASQNGAIVHWSEDRPITLLEARRAQGWRDDEPIIGSIVEQYRIVGNGVDRKVSFALGLALRQVLDNNRRPRLNSLPLQVPEEILVDVDETTDDTASLTSTIHVNVPVLQRGAPTSTNRRSHTYRDSSMASSMAGNASDEPGLDGTNDVRDEAPEPDEHITLPSTHVPHRFRRRSRMPTTVSTGLEGFALRAKSNLSIFTATATRGKRGRDEHLDTANQPSSLGSEFARKRTKTESKTQSPTAEGSRPSIGNKLGSVETASNDTRSTRHSGLVVLYEPKQWNRKPEHEHVTIT